MAKKQDRSKESPLVAVAICEGNSTTLITPHGEYLLSQGHGLVKVTDVKDYAGRVKEEMLRIAGQVEVGSEVYSDRDIRVQIRYGAKPINLS